MDRLLPGYSMEHYSISHDGKQIAFTANDAAGHPSMWISPMNRRSSPARISSTKVEDSPHFLPDGDLVFRAVEGGSNFLYRMKADGSGRRKITAQRVLDLDTVSPDGRWVPAAAPMVNQEHTAAIKAFRVGGAEEQLVCTNNCLVNWDTSGKFVFFGFKTENSYALPLTQPFGLPKLPPAGVSRVEDFPAAKTAITIPNFVESAISPSFYAYTRRNTDAICIGFSCNSSAMHTDFFRKSLPTNRDRDKSKTWKSKDRILRKCSDGSGPVIESADLILTISPG